MTVGSAPVNVRVVAVVSVSANDVESDATVIDNVPGSSVISISTFTSTSSSLYLIISERSTSHTHQQHRTSSRNRHPAQHSNRFHFQQLQYVSLHID